MSWLAKLARKQFVAEVDDFELVVAVIPTPAGEDYQGSMSLTRSGSVLIGAFQSDQLGERTCTGMVFHADVL